jgi:hypothetical protein
VTAEATYYTWLKIPNAVHACVKSITFL